MKARLTGNVGSEKGGKGNATGDPRTVERDEKTAWLRWKVRISLHASEPIEEYMGGSVFEAVRPAKWKTPRSTTSIRFGPIHMGLVLLSHCLKLHL